MLSCKASDARGHVNTSVFDGFIVKAGRCFKVFPQWYNFHPLHNLMFKKMSEEDGKCRAVGLEINAVTQPHHLSLM